MLVERLSCFSLRLSDALMLALSIASLMLVEALADSLAFFSLKLSDVLILVLSIASL